MESHRLICVEKHTMNTFLYLKDIDRSIDLYHQHVQPSNRQNVPSLQKRIHISATSATQSIPSPRHNDTFVKVIWLLQIQRCVWGNPDSRNITPLTEPLFVWNQHAYLYLVYIYIYFFFGIFLFTSMYMLLQNRPHSHPHPASTCLPMPGIPQ